MLPIQLSWTASLSSGKSFISLSDLSSCKASCQLSNTISPSVKTKPSQNLKASWPFICWPIKQMAVVNDQLRQIAGKLIKLFVWSQKRQMLRIAPKFTPTQITLLSQCPNSAWVCSFEVYHLFRFEIRGAYSNLNDDSQHECRWKRDYRLNLFGLTFQRLARRACTLKVLINLGSFYVTARHVF